MSELVQLWVMMGDRRVDAKWGSAKTGALSPFGLGKQTEGWLFDEAVLTDVFHGLTRTGGEIIFPAPYKATALMPGDVLQLGPIAIAMRSA